MAAVSGIVDDVDWVDEVDEVDEVDGVVNGQFLTQRAT